MVAQSVVKRKGEAMASPLAEETAALELRMRAILEGETLRRAVADTLAKLPGGRLALLSTSDEGAGIAAACAAQRTEPTIWRRVRLNFPAESTNAHRAIFVEPVKPTGAWYTAMKRRFPDAELVTP
jgi:hypothetical protein